MRANCRQHKLIKQPLHITELEARNSAYDRQTVAVMRRVLRKNSNCIDVGAYKGRILSCMVAIAPAGTHHAFEALPAFAAQLRECYPEVQVHEFAVSDKQGDADFLYVQNRPTYSGLRRRIYDHDDPQIVTIKVATARIDDVIPDNAPIAFIKIDVEGGEYHAIKGAVATIRRWQPVIVLEAGGKSTGQYGVTPAAFYQLIAKTLGYDLSTMERWLAHRPSLTLQEFSDNWDHGPEFYFIATPLRRHVVNG